MVGAGSFQKACTSDRLPTGRLKESYYTCISISLWSLTLGCGPFSKGRLSSLGPLSVNSQTWTHTFYLGFVSHLLDMLSQHLWAGLAIRVVFHIWSRVETTKTWEGLRLGLLGLVVLLHISKDRERLRSNASWCYQDPYLPGMLGLPHLVSKLGITVSRGIMQQNNYLEFGLVYYIGTSQ